MIYRRCECNEFAKKNDRRITDDLTREGILGFLEFFDFEILKLN
jgi:hypothetical protein